MIGVQIAVAVGMETQKTLLERHPKRNCARERLQLLVDLSVLRSRRRLGKFAETFVWCRDIAICENVGIFRTVVPFGCTVVAQLLPNSEQRPRLFGTNLRSKLSTVVY